MLKKKFLIAILAIFSTPVVAYTDVSAVTSEVECLAHNIYYESRDQSIIGQTAVALVTRNRVHSPKYPNSYCEVVKQRRQFSWTHDGKPDKPRNERAYLLAREIALSVMLNQLDDFSEGALFYHSIKVMPKWAKHLTYLFRIDDHLFYR